MQVGTSRSGATQPVDTRQLCHRGAHPGDGHTGSVGACRAAMTPSSPTQRCRQESKGQRWESKGQKQENKDTTASPGADKLCQQLYRG